MNKRNFTAIALLAIAAPFGLTACHDPGSTSDTIRTQHICNGTTLQFQKWEGGEATGRYVQFTVPNSAECSGNVPGQIEAPPARR